MKVILPEEGETEGEEEEEEEGVFGAFSLGIPTKCIHRFMPAP